MDTVWRQEVQRWTGNASFVITGTEKQRRAILDDMLTDFASSGESGYVIVNPEMLRTTKRTICVANCGGDLDCSLKRQHVTTYEHKYPELFAMEWDAIVIDECHRALIGKNIMSKSITQTRLGAMLLPMRDDGYKIALSGTPYRGKPELLWGILNWLRPDIFTSYWRWVETYFELDENDFGGKVIGELRSDRAEAYDRDVAPYLIRRTKAEVAPDLPPKLYGGTPLVPDEPRTVGVWLPMEPEQARQYEQMEKQSKVDLESGREFNTIGTLAQLTRLKQFAIGYWDIEEIHSGDAEVMRQHAVRLNPAKSNKYNWLLQFIREREDEGIKVVVASQFTHVINAFSQQLERDHIVSYVLTGETPDKERARIIKQFQESELSAKVFFINTKAGGVAITLDAADELVFLDETWIPDEQEQVEDRLHRVSRQHQVTIWYARSLGTIEEEIMRVTTAREATITELLDGIRGIETARRLLAHIEEEK